MSKRTDKLIVEDILEATDKISRYIMGMSYDDFLLDEKTMGAVVRNIEIIGEAPNRISEAFKTQYANIPWHQLKGMRNRLIHEYFGIDYEIVWDVSCDYIPIVASKLRAK